MLLVSSLFVFGQSTTPVNPVLPEPECELEDAFWFLEGYGFLEDDVLVRTGTRLTLLISDNGACGANDEVGIGVFEDDGNEGPRDSVGTDDQPYNQASGVLRQGDFFTARWVVEYQSFDNGLGIGEPSYYFVAYLLEDGIEDAISSSIIRTDLEEGLSDEESEEDDFDPRDGICEDGYQEGDYEEELNMGEDIINSPLDCTQCLANDVCNDGIRADREPVFEDGEPNYGENENNCPQDCLILDDVGPSGGSQDSDTDGVPDTTDKCPNTPVGVPRDRINSDGCPVFDRDGDGINNDRDYCPDSSREDVLIGIASNGCSTSDADIDGVNLPYDRCPNTLFEDRNNVDEVGCVITTEEAAVCGNGGACRINSECDNGEICHLDGGSGTCVEIGEQCDDGNMVPGDGCDSGCVIEPEISGVVCPNGFVVEIDQTTCSMEEGTTRTDGSAGVLCSGSQVAVSIEIGNFEELSKQASDLKITCCQLVTRCI